MMLVDSRNINNKVSFKQALIDPMQGGLYSPLILPFFDGQKYVHLSYKDFALELIKSFDFGEEELFRQALKSYENFDDKHLPICLQKIDEKTYINELWHGPTRAFKDMALQPFSVLLKEFSKDKNILIICATSGDTGPATLKSFDNAKNIKVICMYPKGGTSKVQELQMHALNKNNLKVLPIDGDFDAAQSILKEMLCSKDFQEKIKNLNYQLCAANSVNFGRILFQIIYHYYVSVKLYQDFKEELEIIIPSGNFGNALGAFYAKNMGAKISKIKIVSNANNVLSEFFNKGIYDLRHRSLEKTISPAMDILLSSNIERLLFAKFKDIRTNELMNSLKNGKYFELTKEELQSLQEDFEADFCKDEECIKFIKQSQILIDPHTATCFKMLDKKKLSIITSTAEWTKFTPSMIKALYNRDCSDEKEDLKLLAKEFDVEVKEDILSLFELNDKEEQVFKIKDIKEEILAWMQK